MEIRITIGMPAYMAEKTIAEAIESVLRQTMGEWELLIIDDGSTDGTMAVARRYGDERLRVICDGEHRGIAARLNQLVEMARGDVFARMDADDVMMPERLERQLVFLQEHPEADVVGCKVVRGAVNSEQLTVNNGYAQVETLAHPTVMGRTRWFRENRYNEAYSGVEDYELWLRVKGKATLLQMEEPLMFYRERMTYDVRKVWRERRLGIRMIWHERHLFGSTLSAVSQIGFNVLVMMVVPVIHLLRLDRWVISRRKCRS